MFTQGKTVTPPEITTPVEITKIKGIEAPPEITTPVEITKFKGIEATETLKMEGMSQL